MRLDGPDGLIAPENAKLTRRGAAALVGGLGFAAFARPVPATARQTSDEGLVTERIEFEGHEGTTLPAYVARPDAEGAHPVVLVVHEIFGVHEYIRDVCRRFAKEGYYAIAPDLYARAGDPSGMTDFQEIFKIVRTATHPQVMGDLTKLVDHLEGVDAAGTDDLAITGFCWGGRVVWMFAAADERVDAGVAWYGRLKGQDGDDAPQPIDIAADLNAPVLGLYGGQDRGIPVEDVEAMRAALKAAGDPSEIVLYDDAPHGFHADYRDSYREDAAADGWTRLLAWFRENGVG